MPAIKKNYHKLFTLLFIVVLLVGLYLRFYQYFMGRSLWEDEAHLALNFMTRDFAGILKPLDYIQAAPPLFLLTTKLFTVLFGFGPKALHALPFVSSVLSLPLFYFIARDLTKNKVIALISFLIFAANLSLIYFSSELKTYGIDVVMLLVMLWLTLTGNTAIVSRRNTLLTIAGSIFILYSNVTFVIMFCIGIYMFMNWIKGRKIDFKQLKVLVIWAVVFSAYYFLFLFHHPHQSAQVGLYAFAFPPRNLFSNEFITFLTDKTNIGLLLYVSPAFNFVYILILIFAVAIISCVKHKRLDILLFTMLPLILHFLLSLLHIYPFWYRFLLYLMPGLMLLMALGTFEIVSFIARKTHKVAGVIITLIFCGFFIWPSLESFPLWFREIKPSLNFINTFPSATKLYITTPYTLYKYSQLNHDVNNNNYEALQWPIAPKQYFESVGATQSDYLLLHATDTNTDGYGQVYEALKSNGLIKKEFSFKTYTVSLVRPLNQDGIMLNYNSFEKDKIFDLNGKNVIALWSNAAANSSDVILTTGKYEMTVFSCGTPALNIYPHINVFVNDSKVGDYFTSSDYNKEIIQFEQKADGNVRLKLLMDNDLTDIKTKEDRNAFILYVQIRKASS
jgi:hypothetical protein